MQKKWIQAILFVLILSSCGEMSDTTDNLATNSNNAIAGGTERINGIPVPPEPDPIANNATLVGIDTNGNGVRDDIERKLAQSVAPSSAANSGALVRDGVTIITAPYLIGFFTSPEYKKYLDTVYNTSTIEASEITKVQDALDCYVQKHSVHKYKGYLEYTFNTEMRRVKYLEYLSKMKPSIIMTNDLGGTKCT